MLVKRAFLASCKHVIYTPNLSNDILYRTIDPLNRNIFLSVKSSHKLLSCLLLIRGGLFLKENYCGLLHGPSLGAI